MVLALRLTPTTNLGGGGGRTCTEYRLIHTASFVVGGATMMTNYLFNTHVAISGRDSCSCECVRSQRPGRATNSALS